MRKAKTICSKLPAARKSAGSLVSGRRLRGGQGSGDALCWDKGRLQGT